MVRKLWSRVRRVRWWQWLVALAIVLIAIRVSLPPILRQVMASQASQVLNAHVEIGDIDLALLRGGVAIKDLAIRERTAAEKAAAAVPATPNEEAVPPPSEGTAPPIGEGTAVPNDEGTTLPDRGAGDAPIATESPAVEPSETAPQSASAEEASAPADLPARAEEAPAPADPPLIGWKRFAVELDWLPLFSKTVRLRAVELEAPFVAVDRLESGDINLAALVPKSEPAEEPESEDEDETGSAWGFGVDRFTLSAGKLRFHDLMVEGTEPVDISLDAIEVKEVAVRPGMYGEPANVHLTLKVDDGTLTIDARLAVLAHGVSVDADIKADHLPVHRSRSYIPDARWTRLDGYLGMQLKYRLETEKENVLSGAIALDGVTAGNEEIEQPVLAWKRFDVTIKSIDLIQQDAQIAAVWLDGLRLPVRAQGDDPLPAIATGAEPDEETDPEPAAAPSPAATKDGEAAAKPWRWSVDKIELTDARAVVIDAQPPLDVELTVALKDLQNDLSRPSPLQLSIATANGTIDLEGALRAAPPGFDGRLKVEHLDIPTLVATAGVVPTEPLQSATIDTDLELALGSSAPTAGDVQVQGTVALRQARVVGPDEKEFMAGVEAIEVSLDQVRLPGVMNPSSEAAARAPITVDIGSLRIVKPIAQITNTDAGIVLPQLTETEAQAEQVAVEAVTPPPPPASEAAAPTVQVTIDSLQVSDGKIGFNDRTVSPHYVGTINKLTVDARGVRWPEQAVQKFEVKLTTPPQGALDVKGSMVRGKGTVEVVLDEMGLLPFNPYATAYSPYSIANGALTLKTKAKIDGAKYGVTNAIRLESFDLGGQEGDSTFQQQFGIPLSLALSLLRDLDGAITLDVPLDIDEKGTSVGVGTIVAGALRRALVGALASPLKMFGAVVKSGKVQALAPPTLAFRPGRDVLAAGGDKQLEQLGAFLASRPAIGLTLSTAVTAVDARWLKEQALRAELEEPQGFFGSIRNLGKGDERRQISAALEARRKDEKAPLEGEAAAMLEQMLAERPDPTAEELRALAESRLTRIEATLAKHPGVTAERITRSDVGSETSNDQPLVRLTMGPVEDAS